MSNSAVMIPRRHIATVTERGQLTLPAEIRRLLGVGAGHKVVFDVDEQGVVRVEPMKYTLESLFGSLPHLPGGTSDDFEKEIREAREERAERLMAKMRDE